MVRRLNLVYSGLKMRSPLGFIPFLKIYFRLYRCIAVIPSHLSPTVASSEMLTTFPKADRRPGHILAIINPEITKACTSETQK